MDRATTLALLDRAILPDLETQRVDRNDVVATLEHVRETLQAFANKATSLKSGRVSLGAEMLDNLQAGVRDALDTLEFC